MKTITALIVTGYGINCEKELAHAYRLSGAAVDIEHINSLLCPNFDLKKYQMIGFPGGFSFGDDLGAGKAYANRISYSKHDFKEKLIDFVKEGKSILGICNGFQLLVKLGLLPQLEGPNQIASLAFNESHRFEARWVNHQVEPSPCIFTRGVETLYLPVRHGEGRFVMQSEELMKKMIASNQIVLKYADSHGKSTMNYPENPNGSTQAIAGVCDPTGRIFGLMAHPEAAFFFTNHPYWHTLKEINKRNHCSNPYFGDGITIFKNAINYLRENL